MDTLTCMKFFFPFKLPDFRKRGIESVWSVSGSDWDEAALSLTFSDDPRAKVISFMRSYGEPYEWLKEVFLDWVLRFKSSYLYYHDRDILDKNALSLYRKGLACLEGNAPTYHLALREYPIIVWDFHSLTLTVKFMFSVKLTDVNNPVKLCEHCRMVFHAPRVDSRFCCAECRNKESKKP